MTDDLLRRLQDLDDDPAASAFVGSVVADAIIEIKRLRAMTTDPDEGRRQAEAMKPEPLKVGDKVRLKAGGERTMTVVALEDYDNRAVCEWNPKQLDVNLWEIDRDTFPVSSLVQVD